MQFGRSSEKLDTQIAQLELMLEDLEESEAARTASAARRAPDQPPRERRQPVRRPLPDHLPREEIVHDPGPVCPGCGGTRFAKLGEDVTEILEKIPARLKVIRHIRPKLSCRCCERIVQAPMPDLPIAKGRPGPGLVANIVINKYLDGLPLYRQSAILAREGIAIERATLADWVGHAAWWVTPLAELIGAHVLAAPIIHTDDTPIAVLAPGNGKTRTGRLWTYVVDERPWQGGRAPAAYYRFSPDRRGERPRDHLARFRGVIQADAFSGYHALTRPASVSDRVGRGPPPLIHAACWAHARRKFYDVFEFNQIADRRRGAQTDWRALPDRSRDYWPVGRNPTGDTTEPCRGDPRRLARLADRTASPAVSKERARQSDPIRAQPLGGTEPLCR